MPQSLGITGWQLGHVYKRGELGKKLRGEHRVGRSRLQTELIPSCLFGTHFHRFLFRGSRNGPKLVKPTGRDGRKRKTVLRCAIREMTDLIRVLRVVVASPSDVQTERDLVPVVIEGINRSLGADRGVRLEAIRWETDAYPGLHPDGPQGLIDPILKIEDCDVLVGIFWKRFGTSTREGTTGTEHEFQTAYKAWKNQSRPQVMVYFNQEPYAPQSREEIDQWGKVLDFREAFPKEGLWWPYRGTSEFEKLLREHLSNFLRLSFPIDKPRVGSSQDTVGPLIPATAVPLRPDYFAVQVGIIEEYSRTFVGRTSAQQAFRQFIESHRRGYFILRGGPGQGKTAFSCHLIKSGHYVHHFISRTGGRTDSRLVLRSLVFQLLQQLDRTLQTPESISELTKVFEELLFELSNKGRQVVIIIDALDELPPEITDNPPYLVTDTLPNAVFFVVTARPGVRLDRLRALQFGTPHQMYDLGPLNLDEITQLLRSRRPTLTSAEAERIADASQGNPLYLRAVLDQLEIDPTYDLRALPSTVEEFFKYSIQSLGGEDDTLHDTLGLLSVARTPLSLGELASISGRSQREIDERGIRPVRQFLIEIEGGYTFYHARFHEFVTRAFLYEDEVKEAHRRIAAWLKRPANRTHTYRLSSLAYHLSQSGDCDALLSAIDEAFLVEKIRQLGYQVLEDVELCTRCLLAKGDPAVIEHCVAMIEGLRDAIGGDIVKEAANLVQPYRSGPPSFRTRMITYSGPTIPGLDLYISVLPKAEVSADFFEVVPMKDHLVVAIGDAPASGLKSAFVARFIATLFRDLITNSLNVAQTLAGINTRLAPYDYFQRVSMLTMDVDPGHQLVHMANAGHPYPVRYSAKTEACDVLPIQGDILADVVEKLLGTNEYQIYDLSISPGDVLVMISDGLTEAHLLQGDPYGYRFKRVIKDHAREGAKAIGEAIIDDWRLHLRESDWADDVSVIVISVGS